MKSVQYTISNEKRISCRNTIFNAWTNKNTKAQSVWDQTFVRVYAQHRPLIQSVIDETRVVSKYWK